MMKSPFLRMVALVLPLFLGVPAAISGSYNQDFTGVSSGSTSLGDGSAIASNDGIASVQGAGNPYLRMTRNNTGSTASSFRLPDLDPGQAIDSFTATFDLQIGGSGAFADGVSLTFGAIPGGNGGGEAGFAADNGLTVAWDTYNNGGTDPPSIEIFSDGVSVNNRTHDYGSTAGDWVAVVLRWDESGLDLTYDGTAIASNLPTPGFAPAAGDRFAFSGRTGGLNQNTYLDDLSFTTTTDSPSTTGGPVITEFIADNEDTLGDEDIDSPDWLEIYNGQD
ncbi:MAG: lectin-like domain-containing protein, partial [Verrucomicrobiales bacterium]